jgi:hypothetical protein
MKTLTQTLETLTKAAESIRNTEPQSVQTMEVGDEWRQGDCRIIRLADDFCSKNAAMLEADKKPSSKLAPGNTQGSRHILSNMAGVKFFKLKYATVLDGPIIATPTENAVTHPEHGHVVNMPAGCYAFPGQRAFAETLRRTQD